MTEVLSALGLMATSVALVDWHQHRVELLGVWRSLAKRQKYPNRPNAHFHDHIGGQLPKSQAD
ncbi:hypothetical protein V0M98_32995 (plasmid) [Pseudomonas silesiensis]|uniref:hypothetical protein n=1 Tax=Pseudomonas silesiensis TaxID=1853130 RepID=UPI0030D033BB